MRHGSNGNNQHRRRHDRPPRRVSSAFLPMANRKEAIEMNSAAARQARAEKRLTQYTTIGIVNEIRIS